MRYLSGLIFCHGVCQGLELVLGHEHEASLVEGGEPRGVRAVQVVVVGR